jgi:hypothetical protein
VLSEAVWFERVGDPWLEHSGASIAVSDVIVVRSWDASLAIFDQYLHYNINGVLQAPCDQVDSVLSRFSDRRSWWQNARDDVKRYIAFSGIPDFLSQDRQDRLSEHLYEFVSMLLAEIIASPDAGCTYFREQLPWFHAGHFHAAGTAHGRMDVCVSTNMQRPSSPGRPVASSMSRPVGSRAPRIVEVDGLASHANGACERDYISVGLSSATTQIRRRRSSGVRRSRLACEWRSTARK